MFQDIKNLRRGLGSREIFSNDLGGDRIFFFELSLDLLESSLVSRDKYEIDAVFRELIGKGISDPAGRAGYDCVCRNISS